MLDCNICKNKGNEDVCRNCMHGELFERNVISEPKKSLIREGLEYCSHCGFLSNYAYKYSKFYCIRCGGLNLRSWK